MTEYKTKRIIDKKLPLRWVIVDETGNVVNRNPNEEELKGLKKEPRTPRDTRLYTDKELLDYLRRFKNENGRSPGQNDFVNNPEYPNYSIYRKRFGSWNNALMLVGLDINKRDKKYTDEELLDCLKQFYQENGRIPMASDFLNNFEYPHRNTYMERFGSWNNALEMTELNLEKRFEKYTDNELLNHLSIFYKKNGRVPIQKDFLNNPEYPCYLTYRKRFGKWSKALKIVGLDTDTMVVQGIIETNNQKARLAEMKIIDHFKRRSIDLSGNSWHSYHDGICPDGQTYEVKSSKLHANMFWNFNTRSKDKDDNKEAIQWYYFAAFNEDYTRLLYMWRVPGEIVEKNCFVVGTDTNREFNIENMKPYDITDKFKDIMKI